MNEFWRWVAIVTLIIFAIMLLSFAVAYQAKQLHEAKALLVRLEEKEKKREKVRRDPIDPE